MNGMVPCSQLVPIGSLRTHPDNPRRGDVEAIRASIRTNGFYGAVVAQRSSRYILAGNHRWQAAAMEGLQVIPVILLDVDDRQAKQILLSDNRTSDLGTYDQDALASVLMNLSALHSLEGTGYNDADLEQLLRGMDSLQPEAAQAETAKPEPSERTPKSAKGKPVTFTPEQRNVIDLAIAQVRREVEDPELPEGRAIEFIVADYLSSANIQEETV